MLLQYRARDFDFGVDAQVVTSLIGGDTSLARNIMQAFGPSSTVINALSFMSTVVLLSKDLESPSPMKSKCDLIFDIYDFHESGGEDKLRSRADRRLEAQSAAISIHIDGEKRAIPVALGCCNQHECKQLHFCSSQTLTPPHLLSPLARRHEP